MTVEPSTRSVVDVESLKKSLVALYVQKGQLIPLKRQTGWLFTRRLLTMPKAVAVTFVANKFVNRAFAANKSVDVALVELV